MSVLYMPGCTLKNKASNFDRSTVAAMGKLDVDLQELERWNCCGTVFSMASDDLMAQMAPLRNLLRAEQQGGGPLLTPCSMCYNTLKRAQLYASQNPEGLERIKQVMYMEEGEYQGTSQVLHPLTYLRDELGWDAVAKKVTRSLGGVRLAAYYGCLLTRPADAAIDDPENPRVFEDLLSALGAEPVSFTLRAECCGSYQTVLNRATTMRRTKDILASAAAGGAEALVTSCPLCAYNLDQMQREAAQEYDNLAAMPVFYFSELMALALGIDWESDWNRLHEVDPAPVLAARNLA